MVQHGALSGLEGIVLRATDSLRLVVSLNLLQRSVAVELDRDSVKPLAARAVAAGMAVQTLKREAPNRRS
jgi:hypothetical protein